MARQTLASTTATKTKEKSLSFTWSQRTQSRSSYVTTVLRNKKYWILLHYTWSSVNEHFQQQRYLTLSTNTKSSLELLKQRKSLSQAKLLTKRHESHSHRLSVERKHKSQRAQTLLHTMESKQWYSMST